MNRANALLAAHIATMPDDVADYFVALCRDVADQHRDAAAFSDEGRAWFKALYELQERIREGHVH